MQIIIHSHFTCCFCNVPNIKHLKKNLKEKKTTIVIKKVMGKKKIVLILQSKKKLDAYFITQTTEGF